METYLYTIIEKAHLRHLLETFYACMNLTIQVLDEHGSTLDSCGESSGYCRLFHQLQITENTCEHVHSVAGQNAAKLGETYIFSCHGNLNNMVFPLIHKDQFMGSILVGPFLLTKPDSTLVADLTTRHSLDSESILLLYDELMNIPVVKPSLATHISNLLYYLFTGLISDSSADLKYRQQSFLQQSRINESIQMYKANTPSPHVSYPYEKEKELLSKVKKGDIAAARGIVNDLLGYVLFSEGNSLDFVRFRAMELTALLSRSAMESGVPSDTVLELNNHFLQQFQRIRSMEEMCLQLQKTVEAFVECIFSNLPVADSKLITKAIQYIAQNYYQPLTLTTVAEQVHLNASYFSTLFKQSTGIAFKEYLNNVRIEEAKNLLANTDYSIIDIAIATGFESQNYFSKIFKKYTGITPRQFRHS